MNTNTIEEKLNGHKIITGVLGLKLSAALQMLNESTREIHDTEELKRVAIETLEKAGYIAEINEDKGYFELVKEGKSFGFLSPIIPSPNRLSDKEKVFYLEFVRTASDSLHHVQLHQDLETKVRDNERIKGILAHELKAPIVTIHALTLLSLAKLESGDYIELKTFLEKIKNGVNTLNDLSGLLYLSGLSKDEVSRRFEEVDVKEMLLRNAHFYEEYLRTRQIGLDVMYTEDEKKPLKIFFNKSVLNAVISTLFGNAVSYSPQGSIIYQGAKNTGSSLEIITENLNSNRKQVEHFGMGSGLGFPFVKSIISHLNGVLETYNKPISAKDYEKVEQFGYEHATDLEGYETFGVRIEIPLNALD